MPAWLRWESVYRSMVLAREVDRIQDGLVKRSEAFFHIPGSGHESIAALAEFLTPSDWLACHYRDKALLIARGFELEQFFLSQLCRRDSHSAGRQLPDIQSAPHLHILSMATPVGNHALQAVGVAAAIRHGNSSPIVVCSAGDGTTQQGEYLEALASATRDQLPVLFVVEDNQLAISTATRGKTFFNGHNGPANEYLGIHLTRANGNDVCEVSKAFEQTIGTIRKERCPAIVVVELERMSDHTNADDQNLYRSIEEIATGLATADPIRCLEDHFVLDGIEPAELREYKKSLSLIVEAAAESALRAAEPDSIPVAKAPLSTALHSRQEYRGGATPAQLTLREALNQTLRERLSCDPRVFLYGEDIEDPKGDVFGVARGLSSEFPGRVVNSALSESTIIGTCIGRAMAGQRPVAFIQFADFLPLAFNQIASELGSMYWRTNGGWQCPVIVMVSCGGYKPGLGPFHAQTLESIFLHVPGLDVVMPSSAGDAAGLLNAAFASERPTIFFYPKACLNRTDRTTSADVADHFVPLGVARRLSTGDDLTIVSWGNPIGHCMQAAAELQTAAITVDLFDLRSLSPWDELAVVESVKKTGRILVVHEDYLTCGFGAEILASVAERNRRPIVARRLACPNTLVPCHFPSQLNTLPSFRRVLEIAGDMVGVEVEWEADAQHELQDTIVAIGSGPADETVQLVAYRVVVGQAIEVGQVVAEVEATKGVVDICATTAGTVESLCAPAGDDLLPEN